MVPSRGSSHIDSQPVLPYALTNFNPASQELQEHWGFIGGESLETLLRPGTTKNNHNYHEGRFSSTIPGHVPCDAQARIAAVGFPPTLTRCADSQICSASSPGDDNFSQCPMTLLQLMCPFEMSDQAFITCMSIALGPGRSSPAC